MEKQELKRILVIGAGRSASTLIKYLLDQAEQENWIVTVGDFNLELAREKVGAHPRGKAIRLDINDQTQRAQQILEADLVISLLPPHMHILPARDCLAYRTHLVTASYIASELDALQNAVKDAGLTFINELGADPGIDHMSAMELINRVKAKGGRITGFISACGALISPEHNNIWGYKFTWSPKNIILAGQGVAKYVRNGRFKYLPYQRLFARTQTLNFPGHGQFEAYANRDSLKYQSLYGLEGVETLVRATVRMPGFCRGWNVFVNLGMTDDSYLMPHSEDFSYSDFLFSFINEEPGLSREESFAKFLGVELDDPFLEKFRWLDLLSDEKIGIQNASPAAILQHILERKWVFDDDDQDMLVMQHILEYELEGKKRKITSSMLVKGEDQTHTAISKTVGLPAGMGAKLILQGKFSHPGVIVPVYPGLYEPVLRELEEYGIGFEERDEEIA